MYGRYLIVKWQSLIFDTTFPLNERLINIRISDRDSRRNLLVG